MYSYFQQRPMNGFQGLPLLSELSARLNRSNNYNNNTQTTNPADGLPETTTPNPVKTLKPPPLNKVKPAAILIGHVEMLRNVGLRQAQAPPEGLLPPIQQVDTTIKRQQRTNTPSNTPSDTPTPNTPTNEMDDDEKYDDEQAPSECTITQLRQELHEIDNYEVGRPIIITYNNDGNVIQAFKTKSTCLRMTGIKPMKNISINGIYKRNGVMYQCLRGSGRNWTKTKEILTKHNIQINE